MKTIQLIILLLVVTLCDTTSKEKQARQESKKVIASTIDSIASAYLNTGKVAGFSIAVLRDRDTLYADGFGYADLEKKIPVTAKTIFRMASVSKLLTSVASMKLVEEGKLSLESTLLEVMPDFPKPEQAKKIKIRHLLSHTSGLEDYAEFGDSLYINEEIVPAKKEYFDFFKTKELLFDPGTQYSYSNSGYILMGMIIEKVSGGLYEDFIEQNISRPLGLSSLKHLNRNKNNGTSIFYDLKDSTYAVSVMDTVYYFKGDGGLSATALDLAQVPFGIVDEKILSGKSLKTMMQSTRFPNGSISDYGLGVRKGKFEGNRVWGHTGGHIGYCSTLAFFPESRTSIVVFSNTDRSPVDALAIIGYVSLAVFGLDEPDLLKSEYNKMSLGQYAGEYIRLSEAYERHSNILIVENEDGHLYRKLKNSSSAGEKLYALADGEFVPERYPMDRIIFQKDNQGNVVGFNDYYNGLFMNTRRRMIKK